MGKEETGMVMLVVCRCRSGHDWLPRDPSEKPRVCPKCNTPNWDRLLTVQAERPKVATATMPASAEWQNRCLRSEQWPQNGRLGGDPPPKHVNAALPNARTESSRAMAQPGARPKPSQKESAKLRGAIRRDANPITAAVGIPRRSCFLTENGLL